MGIDVRDAVDSFLSVVDVLAHADFTSCDGRELLWILEDVEIGRRKLAVLDHALIREIDTRGLAGEYALRNTADLLVDTLRINHSEAAARVRAARVLGEERFMPVAAAQATGMIS